MAKILEYLIVVGLVVAAGVTAWSVLTVNHLFIG
ncbi:hypothetical protein A0068_06860 [Campylobacter lari]|uniref:Uncharacterized protein n=1 Tax=Campylobacter subantarcticus TaxID=497724 RepID=A0ABW9N384_9BACT|nr:hypothetical protein [Campylobacter subantarcticus]EAJ1261225.1 hypothetical protein [Campylobacter lari]EAL3939383.1 hypothetical protein [Campylobacter lari]MPB98742.1 hypothetical protein [Campylobacter subantarcticus]